MRFLVVSAVVLASGSQALAPLRPATLALTRPRATAFKPEFSSARTSAAIPTCSGARTIAKSALANVVEANIADGAGAEKVVGENFLSPTVDSDENLRSSSLADNTADSVQKVLDNAVAFVEMPAWNLSSTTSRTDEDLKSSVAADAVGDAAAAAALVPAPPVGWAIVKMTLPLLAVWLSSPILSVVDTAVVGRTAGMAELASLGPATALCDVGTYFFNFLSLVTTSRVAHALVARDERAAQRAVGDGVAVATVRHTQHRRETETPKLKRLKQRKSDSNKLFH